MAAPPLGLATGDAAPSAGPLGGVAHAVRAMPSSSTVEGVRGMPDNAFVHAGLPARPSDIAEFYALIGGWMLPYVVDRPLLALLGDTRGERGGLASRRKRHFLSDCAASHASVPAWIRRLQVKHEKRTFEYLVVDSPEGIAALARRGLVEIHVWNSTIERLETPDRIVLCLHPSDRVAWSQTVAAALQIRDVVASLGLRCWPRLTGGKELHVVIPIEPEFDWAQTYAFARRIAAAARQRDPISFTLDPRDRGQSHKVFIDCTGNRRGAAHLAAYSPRLRYNGLVGMPLSWRSLAATRAPPMWDFAKTRKHLQDLKRDPWSDFWRCRQRLKY